MHLLTLSIAILGSDKSKEIYSCVSSLSWAMVDKLINRGKPLRFRF